MDSSCVEYKRATVLLVAEIEVNMKKIIWMSFIYIIFQVNIFASPTINWSGVQDIQIGADSPEKAGWLYLDIDNNNIVDYKMDYLDPELWVLPQNGNEMIMFDEAVHLPFVDYMCERLASGALINNTTEEPLLWASADDLLVQSLGGVSGGIAGYWKGADHEYMGVRFTAGDGIHYGWIEMSVSDTLDLATIHSWAYNTVPGEGLVAGVVPEPSTIALFLVGVITFGIKRFK